MQAGLQTPSSVRQQSSRRQVVGWIAGLWLGIYLVWFAGPWIAPDHDFPVFTRLVVTGTLLWGFAGLAGLWKSQRWGWWAIALV